MTVKKNDPTNAELLSAIKEVRSVQAKQGNDIGVLMDWKRGIEIAKQAVDEYKNQEAQERSANLSNREKMSKVEVLKQVGTVLGLVGLVLMAYLASKGITVK